MALLLISDVSFDNQVQVMLYASIALIECLALDADIIATRVRHHSPELVFIYIC